MGKSSNQKRKTRLKSFEDWWEKMDLPEEYKDNFKAAFTAGWMGGRRASNKWRQSTDRVRSNVDPD